MNLMVLVDGGAHRFGLPATCLMQDENTILYPVMARSKE